MAELINLGDTESLDNTWYHGCNPEELKFQQIETGGLIKETADWKKYKLKEIPPEGNTSSVKYKLKKYKLAEI